MSGAPLAVPGFSVRREAARFEVQPGHEDLPTFRVKVLTGDDGRFTAIPELTVKDASGDPDLLVGWGDSAESAARDLPEAFASSLRDRESIDEGDLVWKDRLPLPVCSFRISCRRRPGLEPGRREGRLAELVRRRVRQVPSNGRTARASA